MFTTLILAILLLNNNDIVWQECINKSDGSDIECELCDELFNKTINN